MPRVWDVPELGGSKSGVNPCLQHPPSIRPAGNSYAGHLHKSHVFFYVYGGKVKSFAMHFDNCKNSQCVREHVAHSCSPWAEYSSILRNETEILCCTVPLRGHTSVFGREVKLGTWLALKYNLFPSNERFPYNQSLSQTSLAFVSFP